ncbi:hypothetical protein BH10ACT1_BH10ACT1_16600 [soil metagenome]
MPTGRLLYARRSALRTRQIIQDVAFLAWAVTFVKLGRWVYDLVSKLATPPANLAEAGRALESAGGRGSSATDNLPLIGDRLSDPISRIGDGGTALVRAGEAGGAAAHDLALVLALIIALLPIAYVAWKYLPGRLRWVAEAGAAAQLLASPAGQELFALRALANQPLTKLRKAEADPYGAFVAGRVDRLAALELHRLGLEPPAATASPPPSPHGQAAIGSTPVGP